MENKTTLTGAVIASDTRSTGSGQAGELTLETGSFEYSNIKDKDKDKSYNIGGGASYGSSNSSVNAEYGFTDNRQTNFATIGEGTITISTSTGSVTGVEGLKRDVSQAQYNTKEGGLQGGFTVDDTLVNTLTDPGKAYTETVKQVVDGLNGAKETAELIYNESGKAVENASTWVSDHLFTNDDEGNTENTENGGSTSEQIASSQLSADEKIAAGREAAAKRGIPTKETEEILGNTGWDGNPIEKTDNSKVIDQMSMAELKAVNLPDKPGACMFFSTAYGAADALGITLSPEDVKKVYDYAANKKPPSIGINSKGEPSAYWVNSFPGIVEAVAAVKKVDASNISIPKTVIPCSSADGQKVAAKIIEALKSGGFAEIRYDKDPNKSNSNAHSMRVTGSFIENGNVILSIKDTAAPNTKTFVDTTIMTLYTLDKKDQPVYSDRPVSSYLPITKKNNVEKK